MANRMPLTFEGCAGVLRTAAGARGAVIVSPPGFEDLCAHRSLERLADLLADAGAPTLRFDLPGGGDSMGSADDPALVERWRASVGDAIDTLRRLTGVAEVTLVGLRLGAMLAAETSCRRSDVTRLALLAPPSSGKAYVRELKVLSRVIAPVPTPPPHLASAPQDGFALAAFALRQETIDAIHDLAWPVAAPAPEVLILAAPTGATLQPQADTWSRAGATVARNGFDGYDKMMCDPTATIAPTLALRAVVDFAADRLALRRATAAPPCSATLAGDGWVETGLVFEADAHGGGVLCRPTGPAGDEAVVFVNAGGIRRIGWARQHVEMARQLATRGVVSLRMDLSNIADAGDAEDAPFHYGETTFAEIATAASAILGEASRITLFGACSGAYHCLRAAVADERVSRLVLVNQVCFEWSARRSLELNAWMRQKASDVERRRSATDEEMSDLARLRARLIVRAMQLAKTSAKGALTALRAAGSLAPRGDAPHAQHGVEAMFQTLSDRGVRIDLVYAEGDAGLAELERWFGPDGRRALALPGVTRTIVPAADHLMTPPHARAALVRLLASETPARAAQMRVA